MPHARYRFFTGFAEDHLKSFELKVAMINAIAPSQVPVSQAKDRDPELWAAAMKLEASFLAEMLKSTGLGVASQSFGGGIGEEQFASFMRQAHAEQMAEAGGIGLAESIFESLKERHDGSLS